MATRKVSLDLEAYERLNGAKRGNETMSEVVKRVVPKQIDLDAWLKSLQQDPFSDEFIAAVEGQVEGRLARSRRRG